MYKYKYVTVCAFVRSCKNAHMQTHAHTRLIRNYGSRAGLVQRYFVPSLLKILDSLGTLVHVFSLYFRSYYDTSLLPDKQYHFVKYDWKKYKLMFFS